MTERQQNREMNIMDFYEEETNTLGLVGPISTLVISIYCILQLDYTVYLLYFVDSFSSIYY